MGSEKFRFNEVNLLNKLKMHRKQVMLSVGAVLLLFLASVIVFYIYKRNESTTRQLGKIDSVSRISNTTDKIKIKEWNIEAPVNGNVLGNVTYTLSDNGTKVHLNSSKLNSLNLSSPDCVKSGVNKGSWGLYRIAKKASHSPSERPYIIGNYEYYAIAPVTSCKEVNDISAAFNYLTLYLKEVK